MAIDPLLGTPDPSLTNLTATPRRRDRFAGWTLRRKLVASMIALFVALSLASSAATVLSLRQSLTRDLDSQVVVLGNQPPPGANRGPGDDDTTTVRSGLYAVEDGSSYDDYAYDPSGKAVLLSTEQMALLAAANLTAEPRTVPLGGALGDFRVVKTSNRLGITVYRGLPMSRIDTTVSMLLALQAAFGLSALALMGLGGWWLVGRNLAPLQRVARTAARVSKLPLSSGAVSLEHERVPAQDTDRRTEVGQVGAALNDLLNHVDKALGARHESETQLRQFVADASHELRTPLASIKGYAELSRREREPVPESVTHSLGRIESESTRMASLVEDLLLLARLDAGRPLERESVDLTMLTIDAVSDLRVAGPDHTWHLDFPEDPVEAVGDRARLTQVVINLLNNARVHTPPGCTVTARVRRDGNIAIIQVEDDGPGIAPALLPKIFDRFARGDTARVRTGGSTGLGLSIVAAVASAHGGQVGVSSRPGRTVFTLRLPVDGPPDNAPAV